MGVLLRACHDASMGPRGRSAARRAIVALAATALVVSTAGCSVLGDDDATATPNTIVVPRLVEAARLESILPAPADFGPEFVIGESEIWGDDDEPEEPDDEFDKAIEKAITEDCPAMASGDEPPGPEVEADHEVVRSVSAPDGRTYEVLVASDGAPLMSPADLLELEEMLAEIALCPTSQIEDPETGMKMNVTFDGKVVDTLGDWAGELTFTIAATHPNLPKPLVLRVSYLFFGVGSVAVAIFAGDGVSDATRTVVPADLAKRDAVAANLAMMAAAVQMEEPAEPAAPTGPAPAADPAAEATAPAP